MIYIYNIYINNIYIYIGCGPLTVTVVNEGLEGSPDPTKCNSDLLVTVTVRGPHPIYIYIYMLYTCYMDCSKRCKKLEGTRQEVISISLESLQSRFCCERCADLAMFLGWIWVFYDRSCQVTFEIGKNYEITARWFFLRDHFSPLGGHQQNSLLDIALVVDFENPPEI